MMTRPGCRPGCVRTGQHHPALCVTLQPITAAMPEPTWDPDVSAVLDAIGEAVAMTATPLAVTLQETRQALVRLAPLYQDLRDTLEAVLDVTARAGLDPSWVHDREILDHARSLIHRTAPNGAPDGDTPPPPAAG